MVTVRLRQIDAAFCAKVERLRARGLDDGAIAARLLAPFQHVAVVPRESHSPSAPGRESPSALRAIPGSGGEAAGARPALAQPDTAPAVKTGVSGGNASAAGASLGDVPSRTSAGGRHAAVSRPFFSGDDAFTESDLLAGRALNAAILRRMEGE